MTTKITGSDDLLLLKFADVSDILNQKELEIINIIKNTYIVHSNGDSSLPHSTFLRFPNDSKNRIIGLPAFIGGKNKATGIKWVASFPDNINHNLNRASATIILNSIKTGFPYSILEASTISAKRTAASAALAAKTILKSKNEENFGIIGCGLINFEIVKFIKVLFSNIQHFYLYDIDVKRSEQFSNQLLNLGKYKIDICPSADSVFTKSKLISLATTASSPYITNQDCFLPDSLVLNISLRDLSPEIIKNSDNIVDDFDHVNRENTSIFLASQKFSNSKFVRGNIGKLLQNKLPKKRKNVPTIYSPFGLGILDIALAEYVYKIAKKNKKGIKIPSFFSESWIK
jgi:2,3-diaminopropionate biosynthesis protein SbnB